MADHWVNVTSPQEGQSYGTIVVVIHSVLIEMCSQQSVN